MKPSKHDTGMIRKHSPPEGIMDCSWLFKYLLQHEMGKSLLVDLADFKVNLLYFRLDHCALDCFQQQLVFFYNCNIIVIQVYDALGMFNDRSGIRGNEILTFSHTDYQRTSLFGSKEPVRLFCTDNYKSLGSFHPVQSHRNCFFCRKIPFNIQMIHQVSQNFSISLAGESDSTSLQMFFKQVIVFNNTVMDNNKITFKGNLRMCVKFIRLAMSCPPGMSHTYGSVKI